MIKYYSCYEMVDIWKDEVKFNEGANYAMVYKS
ncbi:hypothetical protein SaSA201_0200 [Streptococcus agalactiae]|nr:hypothetical protein SaSA20_0045a [Streptococcus agalactiae]EPW87833.1 hypothetical protein SAG0121_08400 [Streptococcus agalactiae STIR-CD-07]AUO79841.1 hypothetical protein SaSA30_0201 [Streptococcus agalactiae]AUO81426.1 hypothetical protein SaSA33_0201 [Streptococcus agalactiae]AUO83028.1 hypothetical protein SaSA53_0198 [Streptococcus agalactiae]